MFNFKEVNETNVVVESLHGDVTIFFEPVTLKEMTPQEAFLNGIAYAVVFNCGLPNTPIEQTTPVVMTIDEMSASSEVI